MPRSTSKAERLGRGPIPPPPSPPEIDGPIISVPPIAASGPHSPAAPSPAKTAAADKPRRRVVRPQRVPPRLLDTAGPDPAASPRRVRLTIGSILAPHGVQGEFKLRLQTDAPEHLLTLKRVYLGDETAPRTVLGARLHAGHALMRLQGISSPETVERMRGTLLRISGADARPLAPNEYFLYQIIGLDVFDEVGNRLGRVTDLMVTGANEVLVITPESGPDILLPSHPDVVLAMDPAAGTIVVRPLTYYGE